MALTTLEVTVDSESDDRGLLGMDDAIPPGALSMRTRVRSGANGAAAERLREIVAWAEAHSPVGDVVRRAVPSATEVEIVWRKQRQAGMTLVQRLLQTLLPRLVKCPRRNQTTWHTCAQEAFQ